MGVRISDESHVCLYDSTSDVAFGPVFQERGEAEDFLTFLREGVCNHFWTTSGVDARSFSPQDLAKLVQLVQHWRSDHKEGVAT